MSSLVPGDLTNNGSYDAINQLTGSSLSAESYSYDANGNRANLGYVTGRDNRLLSDGIFSYEYDNEGNRTKRTNQTGEVMEFAWDYRNQLTQVMTKNANGVVTQSVQYFYDALGRRIAKFIDSDGVGAMAPVTERLVYDGDNIVLSFDGNNALTHRYLHGVGVDQVLADEGSAGNVLWALSDHLGTVRDLVNASGAVVNHLRYDSFGRVIGQSSPAIGFRYGFTGREFDAETGLNYYRARYLDSGSGRFISQDPIGFSGGDANLYRYVGNSPTNRTDPSGRQGLEESNPITRLLGIGITAIGAAGTALINEIGNSIDSFRRTEPPSIPQPRTTTPPRRNQPTSTPPNTRVPDTQTQTDPQTIPDPPSPSDNQCPRRMPCTGTTVGGSFNAVSASEKRNGTRSMSTPHHAPSFAAVRDSNIIIGKQPGAYGDLTPTVCMTRTDHKVTRSYWSNDLAYGPIQRNLINQGPGGFIRAQNLDVIDVRRIGGLIYERGISQMRNFTKRLQAQHPNFF